MRLPISEQYFDPLANNNWQLVEDFMWWAWVSGEVLQFATDMYWVETWIEDILDYYDLGDDFEEYLKENRDGYVLDDNEDEDAWNV